VYGRQDFDRDSADIVALLRSGPHVVAHSYGVLGTLIAAAQRPADVRSLTLIEPPLYYLVAGDPEVERLERIGQAVLTEGLDAERLRAPGAGHFVAAAKGFAERLERFLVATGDAG
jgi:pimeloyl-ACP methyl ester carboxylesterase